MANIFENGDRRAFLYTGLAAAASTLASCSRAGRDVAMPANFKAERDLRPLAQFPEKAPLILLTDRPPQLETPLRYFREDLTPNEAHFVRWHLSGIPSAVDLATYRLGIGGNVAHRLSLSFDELKRQFEPVSVIAVNQCSGNARGLFEPRVAGGQWRQGAMSNARWTGVRLKDLLAKAGMGKGTVEVSFLGLDKPPLAGTPPFEKSIPVDLALNPDVLVAYEMNGKPLPLLNGFPARLVVPGWYATYWVKSLATITVRSEPLDNFWMTTAYRIPRNKEARESPDHLSQDTVPINRLAVHSIFVVPEPGVSLRAGEKTEIQGLAIDSGSGIQRVEWSADDGRTWAEAELDPELGRYSWRRWRAVWTPRQGAYRLRVRATNRAGESQPESHWNRSGYERRVIETLDVRVV